MVHTYVKTPDVVFLTSDSKSRLAQQANTLSGGEQQMLAIGRGLMSRPSIMLLDEPSLGLSPILVKEIFNILRKLNKEQNLTILLVEQNAKACVRLSRLWLCDGVRKNSARWKFNGSKEFKRHTRILSWSKRRKSIDTTTLEKQKDMEINTNVNNVRSQIIDGVEINTHFDKGPFFMDGVDTIYSLFLQRCKQLQKK